MKEALIQQVSQLLEKARDYHSRALLSENAEELIQMVLNIIEDLQVIEAYLQGFAKDYVMQADARLNFICELTVIESRINSLFEAGPDPRGVTN